MSRASRSDSVANSMNALAQIVLDDHRDITRIKNAMSQKGAEDMIKEHNKSERVQKYPNLQWHGHFNDFNNDGYPDVVIHRGPKTAEDRTCKGAPVIVNGWKTKKSDYPMRQLYFSQYPTAESRKGHKYSAFVDGYGAYDMYPDRYDTATKDWIEGINNSDYKNVPKLTPFTYFVKHIFSPLAKQILFGNNMTYDVSLVSKAQGDMYNDLIKTPSKGDRDEQIRLINELVDKMSNPNTFVNLKSDVNTYLSRYFDFDN